MKLQECTKAELLWVIEQAEISRNASMEYVEILKPYDGQKIIDIPIEVF